MCTQMRLRVYGSYAHGCSKAVVVAVKVAVAVVVVVVFVVSISEK